MEKKEDKITAEELSQLVINQHKAYYGTGIKCIETENGWLIPETQEYTEDAVKYLWGFRK